MKQDVPPPYTAVARHAVFPEPTHDEAARYNVITALNKYLSGSIGTGNKIAYDTRVLPKFKEEHGRDPKDRSEIRKAMNRDPFHQLWSASRRNSMEMRQQNGRAMALRQLDELDARARTERREADVAARSVGPCAALPVGGGYSLHARQLSWRGTSGGRIRRRQL